MKAIVVGCGRVGSAVAKKLTKSGWDVTAIDENEEALARLGENWSGGFVVGHGMDVNVLRQAGIEDADAVVVATNGDNTNIVVGQVAQKRFGIECTVVRILDPARAELYSTLGLRTVSPTSTAIEVLSEAVKSCAVRPRARFSGRVLMFVLVAGGGKVGSNVARTLRRIGHEVTIIEQRGDRIAYLEEEFEHAAIVGDATEIFVLERAGIARPPDLVVAVTGDDEDNMVICQMARERYGVAKVIARVNDPRNEPHFDLLGISPTVSATQTIMALIEHEVPEHELIHLLELRKENLEIVEVQIDKSSPSAGKRISGLNLPSGSQLISIMREGHAEIPDSETELQVGDQVLAILEPGKEDELRRVLLKK